MAKSKLKPSLLDASRDALSRLEEFCGTDCECDNTHQQNGTVCGLCLLRNAIQTAARKPRKQHQLYRALKDLSGQVLLGVVFEMSERMNMNVILLAHDNNGNPLNCCQFGEITPTGEFIQKTTEAVSIINEAVGEPDDQRLDHQVNVRFTKREVDELKRQAEKEGITVSQLLRRLRQS
jgi:hypothetical protein